MIRFAVIGGGWRAEFYFRIASLMPERFSVAAAFVRNDAKRAELAQKYNIPVCATLRELLQTDFDFIVSCVSKQSICDTIKDPALRGIPVLTETPVGADPAQANDILAFASTNPRVQVAEQYQFQPRCAAIKSVIDSGILGEVNHVQVSLCHDYHAMSLIRLFLGVGHKLPKVTTVTLPDRVARYDSRAGFCAPEVVESSQKLTVIDFGSKSALYDFSREQYFSDIRSSRLLVRGEYGEIIGDRCTYLSDGIPQSFTLRRNVSGACENLDGFSLVNITGGGRVLYENPFKGARLSDEEIAIATCLVKMKSYADGGESFYSLVDGAQDVLLS